MSLVYWVPVVGFLQIPNLMGTVRAAADLNPALTSPPDLQPVDKQGGWHVLTLIGDEAVLVKLPAESRRAELRLIPISQLPVVQMGKQ